MLMKHKKKGKEKTMGSILHKGSTNEDSNMIVNKDMIALSRAGPVWNEKYTGTQGQRDKILVSFRYRFVLRLRGLVEEVMGKLSEKIWIKNIDLSRRKSFFSAAIFC